MRHGELDSGTLRTGVRVYAAVSLPRGSELTWVPQVSEVLDDFCGGAGDFERVRCVTVTHRSHVPASFKTPQCRCRVGSRCGWEPRYSVTDSGASGAFWRSVTWLVGWQWAESSYRSKRRVQGKKAVVLVTLTAAPCDSWAHVSVGRRTGSTEIRSRGIPLRYSHSLGVREAAQPWLLRKNVFSTHTFLGWGTQWADEQAGRTVVFRCSYNKGKASGDTGH
jgi:hypothetical protein